MSYAKLLEALTGVRFVLLLWVVFICIRYMAQLDWRSPAWHAVLGITVYTATEAFTRGWVWVRRILDGVGVDSQWLAHPTIVLPVTLLAAASTVVMVHGMSRTNDRLWIHVIWTSALTGVLNYWFF